MHKNRLQYLLKQYMANSATSQELDELADYFRYSSDEASFSEFLQKELENNSDQPLENPESYEHLAGQVLERFRQKQEGPAQLISFRRRAYKWVVAASVLLILAISVYLMQFRVQELPQVAESSAPVQPLILPGKNGAILTLADGSSILLDSLGNGLITGQQGADIVMENGQLIYKKSAPADQHEINYNILSTPKGRQYQVRLDDGTQVWLNAESSLRYPAVFAAAERVVEIIGEAYFEVAKDRKRPFKVRLNSAATEILVLGTHFNVNAYPNESSLTTTLLEGSIRFTNKAQKESKEQLLKPGQQSVLNSEHLDLKNLNPTETAQVVAWKNGVFDFNGAALKTVMRQLERWYNIEVVYEKNIPEIRFFGKMTKNLTLNDLLLILEKSNVHFKLEGRKITVIP